jgi:hypothetical protein
MQEQRDPMLKPKTMRWQQFFFMDKFETMQKREKNGISKKEESHVVAPRKNKERDKKNVNFSSIYV